MLNKLKISIILTVVQLSIVALVALSAVNFESYIYDYKGSSVVKLTMTPAGYSGGTGFLIKAPSGKLFTLTNKHVCGNSKILFAIKQDGSKEPLKVIEKYKGHDLCILEPATNLRPLSIASSVSLHERLWLVGHPGLRPLTLESGHFIGLSPLELGVRCAASKSRLNYHVKLAELRKERMRVPNESKESTAYRKRRIKIIENQLAILQSGRCVETYDTQRINNISYRGNSGSPVLNKYGNIVGVLFAGSPGQPTNSFTVPLRHIKAFLKDK